MVRPTRGGGGTHLWLLDAHDGTFRLNGEPLAWDQIERRLSALDDHIVTDFVHQASYARRVHPDTTNTVRVLTMHDDRGPFIAAAVHRFGTPASAPADNWSKGGLSAAIDVETGMLGAGVQRPRAGSVERRDVHPATGAQISGIHVPNWEAVRDGVLRAAGLVPFLPYVGWDLIVTDDGDGFSVVEGNKYTDVNLLQVHGPLMAAARVRAFFAAHGI